MPLHFAYHWDIDWVKKENKEKQWKKDFGPMKPMPPFWPKIFVGTKEFTDKHARAIIREAIAAMKNSPDKGSVNLLISEIDTGVARVINGPHRSKDDSRLHLTINCKKMNQNFHIYITDDGKYSGSGFENVGGVNGKKGNPNDDWNTDSVADSSQL